MKGDKVCFNCGKEAVVWSEDYVDEVGNVEHVYYCQECAAEYEMIVPEEDK